MTAALAVAAARFPGWTLGWWRDVPEGRVGVEVTRRISYARFRRVAWVGRSWDEINAALRGTP
jgi:hypothetical protein